MNSRSAVPNLDLRIYLAAALGVVIGVVIVFFLTTGAHPWTG